MINQGPCAEEAKGYDDSNEFATLSVEGQFECLFV